MSVNPHWLEYVKAFGPALIAIFVAYVAYRQWQVNQANLREKLFERRFEVFKTVQRFLSQIMRDASVNQENLPEFFNAIQLSRFLFGKEMQAYLTLINDRALNARMYETQIQDSHGKDREALIQKESDEIKWLGNQLTVIFDKFEPYLGFEQHQ